MAKLFLIISFALLGNLPCSAQKIIIKHISGFSDKPIYTLVFTLKDSFPFFNFDIPVTRFIKLGDGDFTILNDFANSNKTNVSFSKYEHYPYGAFQIQILSDNENLSYVLIDAPTSIIYFNKLISLLKEDYKLNRLDYFRDIITRKRGNMPKVSYWFESIVNRIE
jgi:hypothetical protein